LSIILGKDTRFLIEKKYKLSKKFEKFKLKTFADVLKFAINDDNM